MRRGTSKPLQSPIHSPRKCTAKPSASRFLFPDDKCLFCDKRKIKKKGKEEYLHRFTDWAHKSSGWENIEKMVKEMRKEECSSLLRKVTGVELFAAEAHYHRSCYQQFHSNYQSFKGYHLSTSREAKMGQETLTKAHAIAYSEVKAVILKEVIGELNVLPLTVLRETYIRVLERENQPNEYFRADKLKKRLEKDEVSSRLEFAKVELYGCVAFWWVYFSKLPVAKAATATYLLATKDHLNEAAKYLRESILAAYKKSEELPWPPMVEDIKKLADEPLPEELERFLHLVFSGNEPDMVHEERTRRFVFSIGQDICRAVSKGRWKLAKHILICTTIRHLYRSKQLTTILNRLCHCESYSFGIELETAMAKAVEEMSTYLTPQIVTGEDNEVFHGEWDNLNKILTNVTGSNVVNIAAGIMLQESKSDIDSTSTERTISAAKRTKERSLKIDAPTTLAPVTIYNRVGPNFPENAVFTTPAENDLELKRCMKEYDIWILSK